MEELILKAKTREEVANEYDIEVKTQTYSDGADKMTYLKVIQKKQ